MLRCPITDNRSRDKRQPGCVQTHEHDLRIARAVLLIVQFLKALHRLQAERCRRTVEPEEVRREIQRHVRDRGVTARYLWKNVDENRTQEFCDPFSSPAVDQQLQYTAEERQVRNQRQQEVENRVLARRQDTVGSLFAGVDLYDAIVDRVVIIPNRDLVIGRSLQALLQFRWKL